MLQRKLCDQEKQRQTKNGTVLEAPLSLLRDFWDGTRRKTRKFFVCGYALFNVRGSARKNSRQGGIPPTLSPPHILSHRGRKYGKNMRNKVYYNTCTACSNLKHVVAESACKTLISSRCTAEIQVCVDRRTRAEGQRKGDTEKSSTFSRGLVRL